MQNTKKFQFLAITLSLTLLPISAVVSADSVTDTLADFLASDMAFSIAARELKLDGNRAPQVKTVRSLGAKNGVEDAMVTLTHGALGEFQLRVRRPINDVQRVPVVFLTAGVNVEAESLGLLADTPGVALVTFDYGVSSKIQGVELMKTVVQDLPRIIGRVAASMKWLATQSWVRPDRINTIHVSFGSYIAPYSLRLAEAAGVRSFATVFAFGGAEAWQILLKPDVARLLSRADFDNLKRNLDLAMRPFDPVRQLPFLRGRFLVLRGAQDEMIPVASSLALENALPEPKQIEILQTPHIGVSRPEIISQAFSLITQWFTEQRAI
jgi:hypothetical protein